MIKQHRTLIIVISATVAALLLIILSIVFLSAPTDNVPATVDPVDPDNSTTTTTDNSNSGIDYSKVTDLSLVPPVIVNSNPSNKEAWAEYEKNVEQVATKAILEYYTGRDVKNQWLIWISGRSQVADGAYPEFRFTADIDGENISVGFKLTLSGDKIVLMPGSVQRLEAPLEG